MCRIDLLCMHMPILSFTIIWEMRLDCFKDSKLLSVMYYMQMLRNKMFNYSGIDTEK